MLPNFLLRLVCLMILLVVGQPRPALAGDRPGLVGEASKRSAAANSGEAKKVDANWNRDLFGIFREEAELTENELIAAMPKPKPVPAKVVQVAPVVEPKKSEPVKVVPKKVVKLKGLKLQGIVVVGDHAAALVDGKIVRQGEVVEGWTVSRITRNSISALGQDEEREFELLVGSEKARVHAQAKQE